MSDTDESKEQSENETALIQSEQHIKLEPLYRQFTPKLWVLLLTVMATIGLIATLFYQSNTQNNALVENQLEPLIQQLKKTTVLQKANELVDSLLISANAEEYVSLHAELIATDRQLLQLNNSNVQLFQQWLNKHKSAEDIVLRIKDSHARNQQLKQSGIIQLQLMLFTMKPIIDQKLADQKLLQEQLQARQTQNRVSFSQANAYVKTAQQLDNLQSLQSLLAEILVKFEQLTMYTSIAEFELLRLNVEQAFSQNKLLKTNDNIKTMVDVNQQIDAFEKIVLTEQRALAKWQGYIRLAQDYHANLEIHQKEITQLLLLPYDTNQVNQVGVINDVLSKLNIELSNKSITVILMVAIALLLLFFCYLLWSVSEQVKLSTQQSVEIIIGSLQTRDDVVANSAETQTIIEQIQSIAKPEHTEQEYQALSKQYQSSLQMHEQKEQELERLEKCNVQQQVDSKDQIAALLTSEIQCYKYLETITLPIMQQQQSIALNNELSEGKKGSVATKLALLYQQLTQFHLALEVQLDKSALNLSDINLVDEIHAILFNKQKQQQCNNNQLFVSCDEQLLSQAKIDFRLFQQLINLLIDISLDNCQKSQLHLHVQLQDKSAGQQLIRFLVNVKKQSSENLPNLISQLLESQAATGVASPLITIFNILLAKQHGKNVVAQLVDDGYKISFELPLAIATTNDCVEKITLDSIKLMLLSNNISLSNTLEESVKSAEGKFEKLARIDSFQQQINVKHLKHQKLDLLVVDSDMARTHLDLITQQIDGLPHSMQPKLLVLQNVMLSYERFGFYPQAEQILCKGSFLHNIKTLLASNKSNNQLYPCEQFTNNKYIENGLHVLLAVHSPEHSQNLQRLILWLGFHVQVVAHEAAQKALWQTGEYNLLITEFAESALLEMTSKPLVNIGVFSLSDIIPLSEDNAYFESWHIDKLTKESTLSELIDGLTPWLKQAKRSQNTNSNAKVNERSQELPTDYSEQSEEFVITEVANRFTENKSDVVFDFSQYLQHQGTAELALFMLDDYTHDNHQQLNMLVEAIKAKNIEEAQIAISALALNAKILSAKELQSLCTKWSKLLTGSEIPSSLKKINALLKETRIALNEIDEYAESI